MAEIPEAVRAALEQPVLWHLATINDDGAPTTTPVWIDVEDGYVIVNSALGRRKERNVRRDPRVALSCTDPDDPYEWIEIRGRVVETVVGQEAEDGIDKLAKKYLGKDAYPWRKEGERRVIFRIEPTQVITT